MCILLVFLTYMYHDVRFREREVCLFALSLKWHWVLFFSYCTGRRIFKFQNTLRRQPYWTLLKIQWQKMAMWLCDNVTQPFISNVTSHTKDGRIRRCSPVNDIIAWWLYLPCRLSLRLIQMATEGTNFTFFDNSLLVDESTNEEANIKFCGVCWRVLPFA